MENRKFKSSEHAYLYCMCIELGEPELAEYVRDAATAAIAKQRSRDIPLSTDRTEWNKIKLNVMKTVLCAKANSSPSFVQYLLKTGDKFLAEATRDTFWGAGLSPHMCRTTDPSHYPGSNHLGMLLMELRVEILKQQSSQKSSIRHSPSPTRPVSSSDVTSPPPQTQENQAPQPLPSQSPAAVVSEGVNPQEQSLEINRSANPEDQQSSTDHASGQPTPPQPESVVMKSVSKFEGHRSRDHVKRPMNPKIVMIKKGDRKLLPQRVKRRASQPPPTRSHSTRSTHLISRYFNDKSGKRKHVHSPTSEKNAEKRPGKRPEIGILDDEYSDSTSVTSVSSFASCSDGQFGAEERDPNTETTQL